MRLDKKANTKKIYENFLPLTDDITDMLYNEYKEEDPQGFERKISMEREGYLLQSARELNEDGESSSISIFSNILEGEIAKHNCELLCNKNSLARELDTAYRQNTKIDRYLSCRDVFKFSQEYVSEINKIVDCLCLNKSFEEIVSLGLNYAQFTCIYGIDEIFKKKSPKEKKLTIFEKNLLQGTMLNAVQAMDYLLELGQCGYVALFGGRTVCTGQAIMTASIIDFAFKKNGIDAKAFVYSTQDHSFVQINYKDKKYVVDPTQYYDDFKLIKEVDLENAKNIKGAQPLKLKKYDNDSHFAVIEYFLYKFKITERLDFIGQTELVPMKLAKIMAHIQQNLSKLSKLIYPKAVFVNNREISAPFYFELCLNACNIRYKTGCGCVDFIIYDNNKMYYMNIAKAFTADNKLRNANKFMLTSSENDKDNADKDNANNVTATKSDNKDDLSFDK